ncbi:hypothetical protein CWI82_05995 [Pseudidiomarina tainanensis]|jgi:hypothetical protein|uniref:Lipoprotein n=2 Tax=Pseudidiomarina TaxID=2800384 RepID=A0A1I6GDG1_9GAMM|nr:MULTISPECIES: DUF6279 family lipoprotein [Pseudidiomarina]RZQ56833.1 hypothetical protein CWI82_05995 [Pseudidiomarina tainanensis]SFR40170.1 hypothetical protein SAMN04488070_0514 [Pseudidiomarina maritima]
MPRASIVVVVVITLLLSACSTQFGYRFADTLIEWKLNDYVSLNSQQEQSVDQAITTLHQWHATSELPYYAQQLQTLRDKIASNTLTETDLVATYEQFFIAWQRMLNAVEPHAQEMLPQLSDEQIIELIENLREKQREEEEELLEYSDSERSKRLIRRAEKNTRSWLGQVTKVQQRLINRWVVERLDTRELWLDYNQRWLNEFEKALQQRQQPEQFNNYLQQLFYNPEQWRSEELRSRVEHNQQLTLVLFYQLSETLTDRQRRRIVDKLDGYIEDMNEIAEDFSKR